MATWISQQYLVPGEPQAEHGTPSQSTLQFSCFMGYAVRTCVPLKHPGPQAAPAFSHTVLVETLRESHASLLEATSDGNNEQYAPWGSFSGGGYHAPSKY